MTILALDVDKSVEYEQIFADSSGQEEGPDR